MSGSGGASGRHRAHGRGDDPVGGGNASSAGDDVPAHDVVPAEGALPGGDQTPADDGVSGPGPVETADPGDSVTPDAEADAGGDAATADDSVTAEPADDYVTAMVGPAARKPGRGSGRERPPRDPVRTTLRGLGQVLITAGLVVLLFVVYELWITNLLGEQKQAQATANLDKLWAQESDTVAAPDDSPVVTQSGGVVVSTAAGPTLDPGQRTVKYDTTEGAGFAKLYVPAFGPDFVFTVVEGTSQADLYAGPGHYNDPMTQYPGQPGNFALAGHRVNKGAPFDDLGLLDSCDAIVIETQSDWYVYRVLPMADQVADWASTQHAHCDGVNVQTGEYKGVYGQEITTPTDIEQIYPVPHVDSEAVPAGAESLITLTTCHPKFSDRQRMIIHGILVKSYPKTDGFAPPELQETS